METARHLENELDQILESRSLSCLHQPIVDIVRRRVIGYEALSRGPSDSPLHPALVLFETAERCGRLLDLERACLENAAASWMSQGLNSLLFVNVSPYLLAPDALDWKRLDLLMKRFRLSPNRVVVEISERYPSADPAALKATLLALKEQGFMVALDDLGTGYSGLKLWSELRPDFVKIDRHFIRDIHADLVKREFVQSIRRLCQNLQCEMVAEGVETEQELDVVRQLDIRYVQGFLFGRPQPRPTANLSPLLKRGGSPDSRPAREQALLLCREVEGVSPDMRLGDAVERLHSMPQLYSLPVLQNGRPLGLLHKWRALELFSTPFGRALYEKRPVTALMDRDALVVEYDTSIEEVSHLLTDEDDHYLKQHFIITREGQFLGLGSTHSLLKHITARRLESARYANPLTLLPGNVPIAQQLAAHLEAAEPFSMVYFDINHFKPFNDQMGYARGDEAILMLAEILKSHFGTSTDMLGHVGGDDFVVVRPNLATTRELCERVQEAFTGLWPKLYPASQIQAGYTESLDREGQPKRFPLVSLSAGILQVMETDGLTPEFLSERAAEAKLRAKAHPEAIHMEVVRGDSAKAERQASRSQQAACGT